MTSITIMTNMTSKTSQDQYEYCLGQGQSSQWPVLGMDPRKLFLKHEQWPDTWLCGSRLVLGLRIYSLRFEAIESLRLETNDSLRFEKLPHKKFAKNAQNHAKLTKIHKIAQKRPKNFNKMREKKQKISTAVKN